MYHQSEPCEHGSVPYEIAQRKKSLHFIATPGEKFQRQSVPVITWIFLFQGVGISWNTALSTLLDN